MASEQLSNWIFAAIVAFLLAIVVIPLTVTRNASGRVAPVLLTFSGLVALVGVVVTLDWLHDRCSLQEILWLACPRRRMPWPFLLASRYLWLLYGLLVPTGIVLSLLVGRRALSAVLNAPRDERVDR